MFTTISLPENACKTSIRKAFGKEIEEEVKKRLRSLGYLD